MLEDVTLGRRAKPNVMIAVQDDTPVDAWALGGRGSETVCAVRSVRNGDLKLANVQATLGWLAGTG